MYACKICETDNVSKFSIVYEGGISNVNARETGTGIGFGRGGIGIGIGRSKIKGVQQTALSRKTAPPAKRRTVKHAVLYLIGFGFIPSVMGSIIHPFGEASASIWALAYIALAAYHIFTDIRYNREVWPGLMARWDSSFLCMKCDAVSIFDAREEIEARSEMSSQAGYHGTGELQKR